MSNNQANNAKDNYAQPHAVLTNDDLLTEILIRLPILCIRLFTTVSKQWLRILTSPNFTRICHQIPNLDPPAGLFSKKCIVENIFALASTEAGMNFKIVQSCNGLLLCIGSGWPYLNNLFKMLPLPDYSHADSPYYLNVGLIMAFDPTKSLNYKVVHAGKTSSHIDIRTLLIIIE
ncbi:hypothetical protein Tco_1522157 [Tanacetum coccineum]